MNGSQQEAAVLMQQLTAKQKEREQISNALLDETKEKDEVKALLDVGTNLDREIASIEAKIKELEFPGPHPGEPINPWLD